MARQMAKTERAARDAMKPYVKDGFITQGEVNQTIRDGMALVESTTRENYTPDQTFYYAGKIAEALEEYAAATGFVARRMKRGRLMAAEMFAAVYVVVREERGDTDVPLERAVEAIAAVRETARKMREEAKANRPARRAVAV